MVHDLSIYIDIIGNGLLQIIDEVIVCCKQYAVMNEKGTCLIAHIGHISLSVPLVNFRHDDPEMEI